MINDSFQVDGTKPDIKDTLNILVTGSASSYVKVLGNFDRLQTVGR